MGPASKPVWLGQLELRVFFFFFFFFPPEALSVAVTGGAVLLRPRGRDGPGFQADVAWSAGALDLFFFFFPPEALSCPRHRGHLTSEGERTRWVRLPSRCGGASWSFGFFFFSSRSPLLSPSPGALYF